MRKTLLWFLLVLSLGCFSGCEGEDLLNAPSASPISKAESTPAENSETSGIGEGIVLPDDIF